MLFTSTLLNVLVPMAAFVATSSPVDARAGHGSRRSHAAVARRNAKVESRDLYTSAAHQARGENPNPRPARKRSTCSTDSTNSTSVASSSSAAPAAATTSSSSSYAAGAASSVVAVASSVVAGAASVVASAASSVINVGANVQTGSATASSSAAAAATSTAAATSQYNSPWTLDHVANGTSFFDSWDVWSYPDPTKGTVDYVDASTAWNEGLIYVKDNGNAVMTVDKTAAVTTGRKSVRLHSKYTLNGGLVIFDAVHMPTGCGTWPAFWSNGPNWPAGGEIDILEGVNVFTENQVSIHTSDGCSIPQDFGATATLTTGNFDNTNCASYATDNQGCGQRSTQANNYGAPFNTNGGGVYAMKWDTTGISVYFFPRESIPDDITAGEPMPSTWGLPQGNFPSTSCDPFTFFKDHTTILDTTFCGDWAGSVWDQAGWAGQSTSCAAQTGYATCSDYVLNNGAAFDQAYWEIKSLKFYVSK